MAKWYDADSVRQIDSCMHIRSKHILYYLEVYLGKFTLFDDANLLFGKIWVKRSHIVV
jgi:hypothetical protein